jgi:hypothetical protein
VMLACFVNLKFHSQDSLFLFWEHLTILPCVVVVFYATCFYFSVLKVTWKTKWPRSYVYFYDKRVKIIKIKSKISNIIVCTIGIVLYCIGTVNKVQLILSWNFWNLLN